MLKIILVEGTPTRESSCAKTLRRTGAEKLTTCLLSVLCQHPVSSAQPIRTAAKWRGELSLSHSTASVSSRNAHSVTCTVTQAVNRAGTCLSETHMSAHRHTQAGTRENRKRFHAAKSAATTQCMWSYHVTDASW